MNNNIDLSLNILENIDILNVEFVDYLRNITNSINILSQLSPGVINLDNSNNYLDILSQYIVNNINNETYLNMEIKENKKVIEPSVLETFKIREYSENENIKTCHITMLDFEDKQKIMELSCKHIFDENSIRFWLTNKSNTCPICRREFPFIEI
jgi:hypothetical protein